MKALDRLLTRGLRATAARWPDIRLAYAWIHQAASVLTNAAAQDGAAVRAAYDDHVATLSSGAAPWGTLEAARLHCLKVTASHRPYLFHCYDHAGLPRTNNDLEHVFGQARYHERRANGRKQAAPALVVRGSVRVITILACRTHTFTPDELAPTDRAAWRAQRRRLETGHAARRAQRRFRRDPDAYLMVLELAFAKLPVPS